MHESTYHPCWVNNTVSDVHSDWEDYGCSNYTVYAKIDHVSKDDNAETDAACLNACVCVAWRVLPLCLPLSVCLFQDLVCIPLMFLH